MNEIPGFIERLMRLLITGWLRRVSILRGACRRLRYGMQRSFRSRIDGPRQSDAAGHYLCRPIAAI